MVRVCDRTSRLTVWRRQALGGGNIFTGTMKVIKEYGASDVWRQMRQCKEAKVGTLVGTDELGNRYYENKNEQFGRDRWVVYNTSDIQMDYDPAAVSAQWQAFSILCRCYDDALLLVCACSVWMHVSGNIVD